MKNPTHSFREIRSVLFVSLIAVISTCVIALLFLYVYGPSVPYLMGNIIIEPITHVQITGDHQLSRAQQQQKINEITFSYEDLVAKVFKNNTISMKEDFQFYQAIASEISIENILCKIKDQFIHQPPDDSLSLIRNKETSVKSLNHFTQITQFDPHDYFRVVLNNRWLEKNWVYFHQPHIYQQIVSLFVSSREL